MRKLTFVDMFSGLGGSSTAALRAAKKRGLDVLLKAINHWNLSCASHYTNHPYAQHFCERITLDRAREIVPGGVIDVLIASPECTNHSPAKNGQPRDNQSRASPMLIADWCSRVYVERFFIENVTEMKMWGPLDNNNKPIPELAGTLYRAWWSLMEAIGYTMTECIVDGADFGDAQHRERLFIMGVRGKRAPIFPDITHGQADLLGLKPYRTARDIVDWSVLGQEVAVKRRLTPATRARIAQGVEMYNGEPFILPRVRHGVGSIRSIDRPLNTVTCTSWDIGLVTPKSGKLFHRSLSNRELMNAMGLPSDYQVLSPAEAQPVLAKMGLPLDCRLPSLKSITSPSEFKTVQIGNAVCVNAVEACIGALLDSPLN